MDKRDVHLRKKSRAVNAGKDPDYLKDFDANLVPGEKPLTLAHLNIYPPDQNDLNLAP
ncbi:MAG: hypothetical protein KFF73_11305 [Cyclobacteriaceae bacterium]|nr:hypothetical protein [Cyclobacteriaceae bacterium]